MSPFKIGFKIWGLTVFWNSVFFGLAALVRNDFWDVLLSFVVLFTGGVAGIPLLFLLVELVKVARKLPYSMHARMVWIGFWTIIGILVFYELAVLITVRQFYIVYRGALPLIGTTIAAFLLSMWWSRRSLRAVEGMHEYSIN